MAAAAFPSSEREAARGAPGDHFVFIHRFLKALWIWRRPEVRPRRLGPAAALGASLFLPRGATAKGPEPPPRGPPLLLPLDLRFNLLVFN